ncbi:MAG: hypothetical protein K8R19_08095, partial [Methanosarcinales archaeon]|nr:hypothetical protein [Methanosarcinales archaeon]
QKTECELHNQPPCMPRRPDSGLAHQTPPHPGHGVRTVQVVVSITLAVTTDAVQQLTLVTL